MKKFLAAVLSAAMVLTTSTVAFAATAQTITDKSYDISAESVGKAGITDSDTSANSLTVNYYYEEEDEDVTGKFTADARMALITVSGFDSQFDSMDADDIEITIDGKVLEVNSGADYANGQVGWVGNSVVFPVELTKSGYTDTYLITVKGTTADDTIELTETAKVTLKLVNKSSYKTAKTATISKISGTGVSAYIVGSKIYLDYAASAVTASATVELTFKDENGALFSAVTWAYAPSSEAGTNESIFVVYDEDSAADVDGIKLEDAAATYRVRAVNYGTGKYISDVVFNLETSSAIYETKAYDVVIRTDVYETDPKGIYFAESSKTIRIGESYTPVVMGVATNKKVDATLDYGSYSTGGNSQYVNQQYIDIEDGETVIGTQEGVSFITATYAFTSSDSTTTTYSASSMKIVVTDSASDTETSDADAYLVTASTLNVRKGPGTSYAKAYTLSSGATVTVESIANGWAKLSDGNYVSAQYLTKAPQDGEAVTLYVTCRSLNVRSGPGTSYSKAGSLSRGDAVTVVSVSNGWAKLNNGTYVSYKYLSA